MAEDKTKKQANQKKNENEEVKQKIRIKIKAFDHKVIDKSAKTIIETAERTNSHINGPIPLPIEKKVYSLNRSPFVHNKAKDQYEMKVHKRLIDIVEPSSQTIDDLSNLSLPAGVDIEIKMR